MTAAAYDFIIEYKRIPWEPYSPGDPRPLNRHVRHDSRSKAFAAPRSDPASWVKTDWSDHIGVLDQGDLGSCTGNASVGNIGSSPFFETLPANAPTLDEALAVSIYSAATKLDSYDGTYPPTDTGSDGLSAAQAVQQRGLISGYTHALNLNAALTALQSGPVITGVNWYSGFDSPDANGRVYKSGTVRGGHEFVVVGHNPTTKLVKARNSWGTSFGVGGYFYFSESDWGALLAEQGDVTIFTLLTEPAPTPQPVPTPTPTPTPADITTAALIKAGNAWEPSIFSRLTKAGQFKARFNDWKAAHGW